MLKNVLLKNDSILKLSGVIILFNNKCESIEPLLPLPNSHSQTNSGAKTKLMSFLSALVLCILCTPVQAQKKIVASDMLKTRLRVTQKV